MSGGGVESRTDTNNSPIQQRTARSRRQIRIDKTLPVHNSSRPSRGPWPIGRRARRHVNKLTGSRGGERSPNFNKRAGEFQQLIDSPRPLSLPLQMPGRRSTRSVGSKDSHGGHGGTGGNTFELQPGGVCE
ncbi:hypothetical protein DPEC_G00101670 [Dallia pectoralis]|uniref:Uncharacterized protein n=1 Tax=Dallia pectoralis TaxID=75939 RepID=A0ACC2GXJ5_DALPE|nr:hypothetical protein DPEC_G00101670 [Dallia pectoralis]